MARLVNVTLIVADETIGKGTSEPDDPVRSLMVLWTPDGEFIASYDGHNQAVEGAERLFKLICQSTAISLSSSTPR
jgi:hypothetical protein